MTPRFCPRCAQPLVERDAGGRARLACPAEACGFVHWNNPTPVVAAVIEHEGAVLLARGRGWPEKLFALVAGFLESDESPEAAVLRELREETGLDGEVVSFIGAYAFEARNELILAFHVRATGTVTLSDELEAVKHVPREKLRPWPFGTGIAVRDWLARGGLVPERAAGAGLTVGPATLTGP
jgi:NADH pyrophosphatase NudC (nudix superfamily)